MAETLKSWKNIIRKVSAYGSLGDLRCTVTFIEQTGCGSFHLTNKKKKKPRKEKILGGQPHNMFAGKHCEDSWKMEWCVYAFSFFLFLFLCLQ